MKNEIKKNFWGKDENKSHALIRNSSFRMKYKDKNNNELLKFQNSKNKGIFWNFDYLF